MQREREHFNSNKRSWIVRAVWSGLSIGTISLLVATSGRASIEEIGTVPSPSPAASLELNNSSEEKRIDALIKKEELLEKQTATPTPEPTSAPIPQETQVLPAQSQEAQTGQGLTWEAPYKLSGPITYYGIDDGYGLEDTLGCTGEPFDPNDPTTAARAYSSPFNCGDRVKVCDNDSCIEVIIKDTCPGCDSAGKLIDLSHGAMVALQGEASSTTATLEGPVE